jgi:hypothetical protein
LIYFASITAAVNIDNETKADVLRIALSTMLLLRCPVTAFITYKSKEEFVINTKKRRKRQRRQNREIQLALMKRSSRKCLSEEYP